MLFDCILLHLGSTVILVYPASATVQSVKEGIYLTLRITIVYSNVIRLNWVASKDEVLLVLSVVLDFIAKRR